MFRQKGLRGGDESLLPLYFMILSPMGGGWRGHKTAHGSKLKWQMRNEM